MSCFKCSLSVFCLWVSCVLFFFKATMELFNVIVILSDCTICSHKKEQIVQTDHVVESADMRQESASRGASIHTKQTGGHIC